MMYWMPATPKLIRLAGVRNRSNMTSISSVKAKEHVSPCWTFIT